MQTKELRSKTADELKNELAELQREQFNLRYQLKSMTLHQTDNVRKVRRQIARVNTVLSEKLKEAQK
ncbi:MAG: 50S ribosomal protein L29 [Succinivibrio sp.]|nr:50S ribosomal protein L29 [Succinivibrio sp.]